MTQFAEIYDKRPCRLGEGPLWHPLRQQLFWFDILDKRLLSRAGEQELEWQFEEYHSAAGWIDSETLMIASETGLWRFDIASGKRDLIHPLEAEDTGTRSNDGRTDRQGGFWISTMGKKGEPGRGAIYRFFKGEVRRLHGDMTTPNSICFSLDGRTAYFADTPARKIMRQSLDADGWPTDPPKVFVNLRWRRLSPDGSVVDADDCVWNAQWGAGRVARYRPNGKLDSVVKVRGENSTCPVFGGANLATLFVTTAGAYTKSKDAYQGLVYAAETEFSGSEDPPILI